MLLLLFCFVSVPKQKHPKEQANGLFCLPFVRGLAGAFNSRITVQVLFSSHRELEWKGALVRGAKGASAQVSKDYLCWAHFWEERGGFQIVNQWQLAALLFFN